MLFSLSVLFLGTSLVFIDAAPVKYNHRELRSGPNSRLAGRVKRESFNKNPLTLDDYSDVFPDPHPISKQDAFSFESEEDSQKKVLLNPEDFKTVRQGSYTFTSPEGIVVTVNWVADENGFQATGDHIPTPPPMPEERFISKIGDMIRSHVIPNGSVVRRSAVSQNMAADSNESFESEESTEVEQSESREQVGMGAVPKRSYTFDDPNGVVLTVNWVGADERGPSLFFFRPPSFNLLLRPTRPSSSSPSPHTPDPVVGLKLNVTWNMHE